MRRSRNRMDQELDRERLQNCTLPLIRGHLRESAVSPGIFWLIANGINILDNSNRVK